MTGTSLRLAWEKQAARGFATGVSLHGHTRRSRECLDFIPKYASAVPVLRGIVQRYLREYAEARGARLDFAQSFWQPPLVPQQALEIEQRQIESRGLQSMVSLTDHDSIDAGMELSAAGHEVPVGVEWTVPFSTTFFHLGIHNLVKDSAVAVMRQLSAYTQRPSLEVLKDTLREVAAAKDVLVVLNHPMWDQAGIGREQHDGALRTLIRSCGSDIHAIEFNGLRSRRENGAARRLAREIGRPLISGGDRHGAEPNAVVNLTNAGTFAEFCAEVRDGVSHVLVLPQYRAPLCLRILRGLQDVLADNSFDGTTWTDRIWWERRPREWEPLSRTWQQRTPAAVQWFVRGVRMSEHRVLQGAATLVSTAWGLGTAVE